MKSYVAKSLAAAVLVSMLLAGGCVPEARYKEALAAARRANDQLTKCKAALRDLRTENQKLLADLQARDGASGARANAYAELQKNYDQLSADFKTLYAKYQDAIKGGAPPAAIGTIVLPTAIHKALQDFAAANPDLIEYLPAYGMVKLKSDLTFAPGSDVVNATAKTALQKFATIVNSPAGAEFSVYVAGHTDDMRIARADTKRRHPNNWYLSVHRAVAVQEVLAGAGVGDKRIGVIGFGEWHPIAANAPNKKGNQVNRRVEIWIVPPDRFLTASGG
jgi:flagellar motor protein MotB